MDREQVATRDREAVRPGADSRIYSADRNAIVRACAERNSEYPDQQRERYGSQGSACVLHLLAGLPEGQA